MTLQHSSDLQIQTEYWKKELTNAPGLIQIPTDFSRSQNQKFTSAVHPFSIDMKLMEKLVSIEKDRNSDLQTTLLTAFGLLLLRYSSQDDFVIGVPIGSRSDNETNSLPDQLPIRFLFQDESTFDEALSFINSKINKALENQVIFDKELIQEIKGKGASNPTDLFNVLFKFQSQMSGSSDNSDENTGYDLVLHIQKNDESLEGTVKYNKELFAAESIERLEGHYITILSAIAENPQIPVQKVPLLTEEENNMILNVWNNTQTNLPKDKCIHHRFEE